EKEFQRLLDASGVDAEENARLVKKLHSIEKELGSANSRKGVFGCLIFLVIVGVIVAAIVCYSSMKNNDQQISLYSGGAVVIGILLFFFWILPGFSSASRRSSELKKQLEEVKQAAWDQMKPLNERYDWDIVTRLISKICPIINFDPYCTQGRLSELENHFGWDGSYNNEQRSILFSQCGDLQGNPFAFCEVLAQDWDTKTYYGSITIHWKERERDADGKVYTVTRSETLTTSVDAPIPSYAVEKFVIYGNEAAPDLTFSRGPSALSDAGDGWFDKRRMKSELKKLKKFSENLDDESQYTLMSNHDFEVLFHAVDRDHEIQFRLLYTPLAMQQIVNLLKDKQIGYGDDFKYTKDHMINIVAPNHLRDFSLSTDPAIYASFDLESARAFFITHNMEYFRQVYFSLAPILCVPLYQQHRTAKTIYGYTPGEESSFWEHEGMANYLGEDRFKHPASITANILKTSRVQRNGGTSTIAVTAHGYRGEERVEYVGKWGGDGKYHEVPVHWIEYLPVERTSHIQLSEKVPMEPTEKTRPLSGEAAELDGFLNSIGLDRAAAAYRRSVFAWMR
ncbi:MAG: hypothetical protein MJ106_06145, partial [Lentisphaeria bacterium]|nr:hypothetical protein [Lentisphaeria bacterium]